MPSTIKLALGSCAVGAVVLALKAAAWWITDSVALLSDALESIVNVVAALAALVAVQIAARPADANHPYGHHKAEYFSAVLEGVMIILAALLILREAYGGLLHPVPVNTPLDGLLLNGVATVINAWWAWILISRGRLLKSPALRADGRHLLTDVITSAGVAVGMVLAIATGWWILDPLMAVAVAVNIMWSGSKVIKESLSGLMDEAVPTETLDLVHHVIAVQAQGALEAHDIRTRQAGPVTFIDFHLVVPGETTVFDAHGICDRIEAALRLAVPGSHISIHVEPEHKTKHTGISVE